MQAFEFRFPGVLNSKQMLVAEAVQARAWALLARDDAFAAIDEDAAKGRLGRIIVDLMAQQTSSVADLTAAAVETFQRNGSAS